MTHLKNHEDKAHKNENEESNEDNICEICQENFATPLILSKHIKSVHVEKELNMLKQLIKLNEEYMEQTTKMKDKLMEFCKAINQ